MRILDVVCAMIFGGIALLVVAALITPQQSTRRVISNHQVAVCPLPTEITLTAPNGAKITVTTAQITAVMTLPRADNFEDARAHAIVGETSGIQQAVRETRAQIVAMINTPSCQEVA